MEMEQAQQDKELKTEEVVALEVEDKVLEQKALGQRLEDKKEVVSNAKI